MEIAGFLAAVLAYGRVEQIKRDVSDLLERMGGSPYRFVSSFDERKKEKLTGFKHRFTTAKDMSDLLMVLGRVLRRCGSIEKFFLAGYDPAGRNVTEALSNFCERLLATHAKRHRGRVSKGLGYLLAKPANGSACKRLNLFLRWMVRADGVDAGLWNGVDKAKLIVPVDVHMGRLCRILGLCRRKTVSWSGAEEITESFAALEPTDPVKYDFALSRVGIVDNCTGQRSRVCEVCELAALCSAK